MWKTEENFIYIIESNSNRQSNWLFSSFVKISGIKTGSTTALYANNMGGIVSIEIDILCKGVLKEIYGLHANVY